MISKIYILFVYYKGGLIELRSLFLIYKYIKIILYLIYIDPYLHFMFIVDSMCYYPHHTIIIRKKPIQ